MNTLLLLVALLQTPALAAKSAAKADPTLTTLESALANGGRVALYLPFEFGKARLEPEAARDLQALARVLERNPKLRLVVEGHADSLATPEENMALSDSRAQSVVSGLLRLGVAHRRLAFAAKGASQPIMDERHEDLPRRSNERIELVDPDFAGVRSARAIEAKDVAGAKEPMFRRMPDYYISSFHEYDSWRGGGLLRVGGVDLQGRAQVVVYRHPDAGHAKAALPAPNQILSQYADAAKPSGGFEVYRSTWEALIQIPGAEGGDTWLAVQAPSGAAYKLTIVHTPAAR